MKRLSFPKSKRLSKNHEFRTVLARKLRVSNDLFILYVAENSCGHPRIGISIAKATGNAVMRNRIKRLLREAFRQTQHQIPDSFDYLFMISPQFLRNLSQSTNSKEVIMKLTFLQVKDSFQALVNAAIRKIG